MTNQLCRPDTKAGAWLAKAVSGLDAKPVFAKLASAEDRVQFCLENGLDGGDLEVEFLEDGERLKSLEKALELKQEGNKAFGQASSWVSIYQRWQSIKIML